MAYIGAEPDGMGKAQRFTFTASGGETVVSADDDGIPIGYTAGQVSVYLNGVKLVVGTGKDCQATNGSTITGLAALAASDVVEVVALSIFSATTVEGTALISTGETGGSKFLREDGDGTSSWQTVTEYNDDVIQTNIAMLAFRTAVNGSGLKFNLQDQVIDEYGNADGVDDGPSTNHTLTSGVYSGTSVVAPTTSGGTASTDGTYTVRSITATGSTNFVTDTALTGVEYLIVGGGGAGGVGDGGGGGGGAGGYISATGQSLAAGTFAAIVGTGGAAAAQDVNAAGGHGIDSSFNSQTAGGGAGGPAANTAGINGDTANGGSGSGVTGNTSVAGGTAGSQGTTNAGGTTTHGNSGGGGGGAGGAGGNAVSAQGGQGGLGLANDIVTTGSNLYYAGGGGGNSENGTDPYGLGGSSVGGRGQVAASVSATSGTANTGSGGGGADSVSGLSANAPGDGGTGVVIIRFLTSQIVAGANLTLQSTDTAAETEADYADMVMLMEDTAGTATVNTDIKGYISEDSGVTFTQGTLVDEGDWGTNKRILAFHDLDISAQSGTAMCYKITTHNQSASKTTKIHATSIGWR